MVFAVTSVREIGAGVGQFLFTGWVRFKLPFPRVVTDADPDNSSPAPDKWVTRVVRTSAGLVSDVHSPANCTGYTHSTVRVRRFHGAHYLTVFSTVQGDFCAAPQAHGVSVAISEAFVVATFIMTSSR